MPKTSNTNLIEKKKKEKNNRKNILLYWKRTLKQTLNFIQQCISVSVYRHYLVPTGGECHTAELVRLK